MDENNKSFLAHCSSRHRRADCYWGHRTRRGRRKKHFLQAKQDCRRSGKGDVSNARAVPVWPRMRTIESDGATLLTWDSTCAEAPTSQRSPQTSTLGSALHAEQHSLVAASPRLVCDPQYQCTQRANGGLLLDHRAQDCNASSPHPARRSRGELLCSLQCLT